VMWGCVFGLLIVSLVPQMRSAGENSPISPNSSIHKPSKYSGTPIAHPTAVEGAKLLPASSADSIVVSDANSSPFVARVLEFSTPQWR
jgi:hypothetical protein